MSVGIQNGLNAATVLGVGEYRVHKAIEPVRVLDVYGKLVSIDRPRVMVDHSREHPRCIVLTLPGALALAGQREIHINADELHDAICAAMGWRCGR